MLINNSYSAENDNHKYYPNIFDKLQVCIAYYEFVLSKNNKQTAIRKIRLYADELNKYKNYNISEIDINNNTKKVIKYFTNLRVAKANIKNHLIEKYKKSCDLKISSADIDVFDVFDAVDNEDELFASAVKSFNPYYKYGYFIVLEKKSTELEEFFKSSSSDFSNENSGDVKGKKLFCYWSNDSISGFGIEFNRKKKVLMKGIDEDEEKIIKINGQYNALSDKIIIKYKNWLDDSDEEIIIDRKTLKIRYASQSLCEPVKSSRFIDKRLQTTLDKFTSEKSSENKF